MLTAVTLALRDLFDPRLVPIWLKSVAATLLVLAVLGAGLYFGFGALLDSVLGQGELAQLALALLALIGAWLAWRIVALAVLQFFADDVVAAIEARAYPAEAGRARALGWRSEARRAAGGAARALGYNLLALPLALALAVTGVGAALVFLAVNAVLLGRELQDMVWLRHSAGTAPAPLGRGERWALGALTAVLLTVPVVNFAAPFLGAACAVHLIHRKGWLHDA